MSVPGAIAGSKKESKAKRISTLTGRTVSYDHNRLREKEFQGQSSE